METMRDAAGSADREMGIITDSIDYKINKLRETWVGALQQLIDRGTIGGIIDFLTTISELLTNLTKFDGLIPTIFGGIASGMYNLKAENPHGFFGLDINAIKNAWNSINVEKIVPPIEQIRTLLTDIRALSTDQGASDLTETFGFDTTKIQNFIDSVDVATASEKDLQEALTVTRARTISGTAATVAHTAAQKAGAVVARLFSMALQTVGVAIAGWAIGKAIEALNNWIHRIDIAKDKITELNSSIKEINDNLSEQTEFVENSAKEYERLSKGVDASTNANISLSNEDYKRFVELNQQLSTLFPQLRSGLGEENTHIINIGNSADITADKLSEILENEKKIAEYKIGQQMEDLFKSTNTVIEENINELEIANQRLQEYQDTQKLLTSSGDVTSSDIQFSFDIGDKNFLNYRNAIHQAWEKFKEETSFTSDFEIELDEINEYTNEQTYKLLLNQLQLSDEQKSQLDAIFKEQLQDVSNSLSDDIEDASQHIKDIELNNQSLWLDYLPSLIARMTTSGSYSNLSEPLQKVAQDVVSNLDSSFIQAIKDDGWKPGQEVYPYFRRIILDPLLQLQAEMEKEGVKIDISKLFDENTTFAEFNSILAQLQTFAAEHEIDIPVSFEEQQENYQKLQDRIEKLSGGDGQKLDQLGKLTEQFTVSQAKAFLDATEGVNSYNEAMRTAIELLKTAEEQGNKTTFNIGDFSSDLDNLSKLKKLYDNAIDGLQNYSDNNPIYIPVALQDVEALKNDEGWQGMFDIEGFADRFNAFEQIVTSANSTKEQVQTAFNDIVTAYANAQFNMQGVTQETANMIESQLTSKLGLTTESVHAYVQAILQEAQAEQLRANIQNVVNQALQNGGDIEQERLTALQDEATQLGLTEEELVAYLDAALAASGITLTGDISFLDTLCEKLGIAIDKLRKYRSAFNGDWSNEAVGSNSKNEVANALAEKLATKKGKQTKVVKDNTLEWDNNTTAINNNTGASGGSADQADKTSDALSKINSEIDALQDAYEKLTKIEETYNEYGHITIDQAQELANMDLAVIAALTEESGTLMTSAEAYDMLTQAKIAELQATLVRKAMDLISSFQNEANAVAFLAQTYLTAADAAMTFASAAAFAESMNFEAGSTKDQATQKALAALQTQLQMVGSVDPHLTLSGAGGGGHEPMDRAGSREGEGEGAGQSYEQDFDWIEKLLERLNKLTAKWTDRADRFFTFWNKNWATNKAIQANQKEQEANQKAYTYYLKEANKVDIDKDYKNRIQNGSMLAEVIEDEELGKKIEEYQKW